jgi:phosphatidylserine/phosphatidylglycerophosphate/cardiolipin synthase-like enzyme
MKVDRATNAAMPASNGIKVWAACWLLAGAALMTGAVAAQSSPPAQATPTPAQTAPPAPSSATPQAPTPPPAQVAPSAAAAPQIAPDSIELVESAPVETTLDHADVPDASDVWVAMIDGAQKTLDFAEFYASGHPGSRLDAVETAIEKAAARGVHVRFLCEERMSATNHDVRDRFGKIAAIEQRLITMKKLAGGILHAKYFLVDGRECYLGSQNFDWRSLEHIQELGVRIRSSAVASALQEVFELDWSLAGEQASTPKASAADKAAVPAAAATHADEAAPSAPAASGAPPTTSSNAREKLDKFHTSTAQFPERLGSGDAALQITPVFSPKDWLPDPRSWDLPRLIELVDGAKSSLRVQLLTYKMTGREYWNELESALRRAANRGVSVQLLVADWCKRKGTIEGLQSLEVLPNFEIKLITIPQWSGGFIPYARVAHAKYMVVDGTRAWIGTSNWEKDYFYESRNVGLVVDGAAFAQKLDRFFRDDWTSPYAALVDPCAMYEPPKIGD